MPVFGVDTASKTPCGRERHRLFREATQLKTVAAIVRVAGVEVLRAENQIHAIGTADRRRPAATVDADDAQRARIPMAVARGGIRLFREATQLKTVAAAAHAAGIEVLRRSPRTRRRYRSQRKTS